MNPLALTGRATLDLCSSVGELILFAGTALGRGLRGPFYPRQVVRQVRREPRTDHLMIDAGLEECGPRPGAGAVRVRHQQPAEGPTSGMASASGWPTKVAATP